MENRASYFYIGIFVFGVFFVSLVFMVWLSGFSHKEKYGFYQIFTKESVSGLGVKSPVRLLGVEVGSVEDMQIYHIDHNTSVRILIRVKDGTPITDKTYANIALQGITGLKFIELKNDEEGRLIVGAQSPQTAMPTIQIKQSLLSALDQQSDKIMKLVDFIDERLRLFASDTNLAHFNTLMQGLANASRGADEALSSFSDASKKMANVADGYGDFKGSLGSSLALFEQLLLQLNETLSSLKQSPSDIFFKSGRNKLAPGEK